MNYVGTETKQSKKYTFGELLIGCEETAFIGSVSGYINELFLIAYNVVILARDPKITWMIDKCRSISREKHITVDYFVDVNITVANKK
jgi:hypothetical protein